MKYNLGSIDGKTLLAEIHDPHRDRMVRAYYIHSDTEVQLHDGVDSWIITVGTCLPKMSLEEKIAALKGGVRPRRALLNEVQPRRRISAI